MESKFILAAISAAVKAGEAILEVYDDGAIAVDTKADDSPLTKADFVSNDIIMAGLSEFGIPILSEEGKHTEYDTRRQWIDFWLVDPLDGTKEFIKRNGEFTVNIAFCSHQMPVFGVIYIPVTRELYYGSVRQGKAYKTVIDTIEDYRDQLFDVKDQLSPEKPSSEMVKIVGSRSHKSEATQQYIEALEATHDKVENVSKGSSLKFCLVAEGKAHVYPRLAPTMEWDTAAGHGICKAVGLKVVDEETQEELIYNKKNLLNPFFTVRT